MRHPTIQAMEQKFARKTALPAFSAGDTVCVWVKIPEGTNKDGSAKFRLQAFEGTCIRYRKGGLNSTFMIRKLSAGGVSVERNFFSHSPLIDRVDVKMRGKVRRSRLYYLRRLKGKAARISAQMFQGETSAAAAPQA